MDDTNEKDPFDGYSVAIIRTFWFDVINLRIFRGWNRDRYSDVPMKFVRRTIHGNAISAKDSVCIIGSELKIKEFSFSLRADESAVEDWQHITFDTEIKNREDLSANKARRFEIITQRCKESAPTAFLGYTEGDWEIGDKSDWWIEALVPEFVMAQLEQDIAANEIKELHFGVKWIAGLVDQKYAPPSVSVTWGLLEEKKNFPETLQGYVTSIGWNLSITPKYTAPCDMEDKGEKEIESVRLLDPTTQSIMALSQVVTALSKRTTSAFVIVTVLIAISYLLR